MSDRKRIWEEPKLIILERGRPEEMVLAGCKMVGSKQSPANKKDGCMKLTGCTTCNVFSTS